MNIKQELAQYRQCFQVWISLIEEEAKLRSLSEKITASLNGMPGGTGDRPGKVGLSAKRKRYVVWVQFPLAAPLPPGRRERVTNALTAQSQSVRCRAVFLRKAGFEMFYIMQPAFCDVVPVFTPCAGPRWEYRCMIVRRNEYPTGPRL